MIRRFTKSISVAIKIAIMGFEEAFKRGQSIDSILGYIDTLTKIPNRKAFERDKNDVNEEYSLVIIDIDNLKDINDTNGHFYGDIVLKRLARILHNVVSPTGQAYRIGGDEFFLIVPNSRVKSICRTIHNNVRKEDRYTVSQGVVYAVERGLPNKTIIQADNAMYQSKINGKDMITVSVP